MPQRNWLVRLLPISLKQGKKLQQQDKCVTKPVYDLMIFMEKMSKIFAHLMRQDFLKIHLRENDKNRMVFMMFHMKGLKP